MPCTYADEITLEMVRKNSGTHFAQKVVDIFFSLTDENIETRN